MSQDNSLGKKTPLWTKYFFIFMLANVVVLGSLQFFNTTFSIYVEALGGATSFTGMTLTLFTISAFISRIFAGRMLDLFERRKIFILGAVFFAVVNILFMLFPVLSATAPLRFLQGVGYSIAATAISVSVSDILPEPRMAEGIGYFGLSASLSQAVAPGIAMGLIAGGNFRSICYVSAGALIIFAFVMLFINYEKDPKIMELKSTRPVSAPAAAKKGLSLSSFIEPSALPCMIVQLSLSLGSGATIAFLMLFAKHAEIPNPSLYFTILAVFTVISRLLMGRIADRYGPLFTLIPGITFFIAGYTMLMLSPSAPVLFLVAGGLMGCASGLTAPTLNAVAVRAAPAEKRGSAIATYMIALDLGIGIGSLLWGFVIEILDYTAMFIGCIIFSFVAGCLAVVFFRKKPVKV